MNLEFVDWFTYTNRCIDQKKKQYGYDDDDEDDDEEDTVETSGMASSS